MWVVIVKVKLILDAKFSSRVKLTFPIPVQLAKL